MSRIDFRANVGDADTRQALQQLRERLRPTATLTDPSTLTFSNPPTQAECEALRDNLQSVVNALKEFGVVHE